MYFGRCVHLHVATYLLNYGVISQKTEILEHTYIRCKPEESGLGQYITILNLPEIQVGIVPVTVHTPGPEPLPLPEASVNFHFMIISSTASDSA
jgi:hypothetical protein